MTLQVTNTQIQIKNSSGTVKFDSDDKLIHKKYTQTGSSVTMGSGSYADNVEYTINTDLNAKDFATVVISVSAANGNVSSDVVGSKVQLNFPFMTNFRHSTTTTAITHYEILTAIITGNEALNMPTKVKFSYFGHQTTSYGGTSPFSSVSPTPSSSTYPIMPRGHTKVQPATNSYITFTWEVTVYSYQ